MVGGASAAGYSAPSTAGAAAGSRGSRHSAHHQADLDGDIDQNREFYRRQDVRPPYTYAALIRQVSRKRGSEIPGPEYR
jgi:hypothetical protein